MALSPENRYSVKVPLFEGPLDLLLHLIRENKVDIYDIPISLITRQYLDYLEAMKELNLEIASEFIVMASTLIYIKSRMLLPVEETQEQGQEEDDPRSNLVNRLLEYQAFKEASLKMREREELWANIFSRECPEEDTLEPELQLFDLNIFDMLTALRRIISKAPPETLLITREMLTLKDKIKFVMEKIYDNKTVRFEDLFAGDRTRIQIILSFLAILEIVKLGLARAYQEGFRGVIWIIKSDRDVESLSYEEAS